MSTQKPPDVSVVIPAYNAKGSITRALDTVLSQCGVALDVIVVDGGSDDGTAEILDALAEQEPRLTVVHQEKSEGAGGLRNCGFDLSRGEYVLFLDADDALAADALAELVAFGREHASDIVVPRTTSAKRRVHEDVFAQTLVDAPLTVLVRNNFSCKLFRRDFLNSAGIRFSEERIQLEDAIFCFRAYARAARTSILADRVLHHLDAFEGGEHISAHRIEPFDYAVSVDTALAALVSGHQPQADIDAAVADFFRMAVLTRFGMPALVRSERDYSDWREAMVPVARKYVAKVPLQDEYGPLNRARLHCLVEQRDVILRRLATARSKNAAISAALIGRTTRSLMIDVEPILSSTALTDVRVTFTPANGSPAETVRPRNMSTKGPDPILGTTGLRLTVDVPHSALRDRGSAAVVILAVDKGGRAVRSRVAYPAASTPAAEAPTSRWIGPTLVSIEADRKNTLQVRSQSIPHVLGSRARRFARRVTARSRSGNAPPVAPIAPSAHEREPQRPEPQLRSRESADVFATHRHVAVTWNIPPNFGGMTTVLLRRSRMFARRTVMPVEILVLSPDFEPKEWDARLREQGLLEDNMRVRGLWSELATWSDDMLADAGRSSFGVQGDPRLGHPLPSGSEGGAQRTDRRRSDGSLLVVDHRIDGRRELLVLDRRGRVAGVFPRRRDVYFMWIRHVLEEDPAVVLTDSKVVAKYLHELRREDTAVGQVFHSTHLNAFAPSAYGPMNPYHLSMIQTADVYDLTVFLTDRQRKDFQAAMGEHPGHATIPNSLELSRVADLDASLDRPRHHGIVVSRLEAEKRVDHAIRALARTQDGTELTVYGSGEETAKLEGLIEQLGLSQRVRLAGYESSIVRRMAEASFLILSSRFEGMGLVVVEAMALGCIPVVYDIRYGPGDIITDGVDGFLVADGDVDGIARAVNRLLGMDSEAVVRMRAAAQGRARDFDVDVIADQWSHALAGAAARAYSAKGTSSPRIEAVSAVLTDEGVTIDVQCSAAEAAGALHTLDVVARKKAPFVSSHRMEERGTVYGCSLQGGTAQTDAAGQVDLRTIVPAAAFAAPPGTVYDFYLRVVGSPLATRMRVPAPASLTDVPQTGRGLRLYSTVKGNLSLEVADVSPH